MLCALSVRRAFSPLDEELQLLPGPLTPRLQEGLVRLSTWMPFGRAVPEFHWFTGVTATESCVRHLAEAAGAAYVEVQTAEVDGLERTTPEPPAGPDVQLLSVDGAMVPLVHGEWGEVKTLVIGTVQAPVLEKGELVVHTTDLSYFSRLTDAEDFSRLATVETHRRGVERAQTVCGVTDGAVWEQGFLDVHRQDAIRILDFPHAAEYVTAIGEVVHGEATPELKTWLTDTLHELKHGSPDTVLNQVRTLQQEELGRSAAGAESIQDSLEYLEKRRSHLAYAEFQAAGYPIGSGAVESGNKLVVEARLKGSGMHWARAHVNPMLALRNIACSDRWEEAWPQIEHQVRQQAQMRRESRRQQRLAKRRAVTEIPLSSHRPEDDSPKPHAAKACRRSAECKSHNPEGKAHPPADHHPWRHMPIGRAVFFPRKKRSDAKL